MQIAVSTAIANSPNIGFVTAAMVSRHNESSAVTILSLSNRPSGVLAMNSAAPQNADMAATQSGKPSFSVALSQPSCISATNQTNTRTVAAGFHQLPRPSTMA